MQLADGQMLLHYRVTEKIGAGGMGDVYRAEDTKLHRAVAIKVLPPDLASDRSRLERFQREARTLASLDHPNIVTIYSVEEADGIHFLTMGLVMGDMLSALIPEAGLEVEQFLRLAVPLVDALAAAHEKGVIHRDLKPANVMVTPDGRLKVLDFGLAKIGAVTAAEAAESQLPTEEMTRDGIIVGTVPYMSPEQLEGRPLDLRADLFSLGTVLYEMATGQRPFRGDSGPALMSAILRDPVTAPTKLQPALPARLGAIIERCLQKAPEARYASAVEVRAALDDLRREVAGDRPARPRRRGSLALLAIAGVVLVAAGWLLMERLRRVEARTEGLAEVQRLVDAGDTLGAFRAATRIEPLVAPEDLEDLWPLTSHVGNIHTTPPGAEVFLQPYEEEAGEWTSLGRTPIDQARLPATTIRLRFQLDGYDTVIRIPLFEAFETLEANLLAVGETPAEMISVAGGRAFGWLAGIDPFLGAELEPFLLDRHEVTNTEFREFVQAGGYANRAFWKHPFILDGSALTWKQAMERFRDATGRPGPAAWALGSFPSGREDHPVGGVSWYEAAAYAEYAGKSLPTLFHWVHAAGTWHSAAITPVSQFSAEEPVPVGSTRAMGPYGTYDMAGNVREWCWNDSGQGRYILGGAWDDQAYMFQNASVRPAFDRSPKNGFRCAHYDSGPSEEAARRVPLVVRDYRAEPAIPDEIYLVHREVFSYDPLPLNAVIEEVDDQPEHWRREKISFDAAYGDQRMIAYLFVPRSAEPPYQTIVFYPGTGSTFSTSFDSPLGRKEQELFSFIVQDGRALLYPILRGCHERHERNEGLRSTWPNDSHQYADYLTSWVKDIRRSIDYLETREDIDADRLAYFGFSWGARYGAIIPAVEPRLRASVLLSGGLVAAKARPEVDQGTYVSRVTIPTLMINGRFDTTHPLATAQETMLELLGTPAEHKRHVLYEAGHMPPRNAFIRETLSWYDRYLGRTKASR